jgi:hypothetical protein
MAEATGESIGPVTGNRALDLTDEESGLCSKPGLALEAKERADAKPTKRQALP